MATAFAIYVTDYDDMFPLAYRIQDNGIIRTWPTYQGALYPATDSTNWAGLTGSTGHGRHWANSIQPYVKNRQPTELPSLRKEGALYPAAAGQAPALGGLTMNGLLHAYSTTSVVSPSGTPLLWPGTGAVNVEGTANSNPVLDCGSTYPQTNCVFGSAVN